LHHADQNVAADGTVPIRRVVAPPFTPVSPSARIGPTLGVWLSISTARSIIDSPQRGVEQFGSSSGS
jgi:hypothetical protein